jgi:hypothetical protein
MPDLPSGLRLAISRDALFEHGGNSFLCPEGHFWFWIADPEIMGDLPFDPDAEIITALRHAAVPKDRDEVKNYIRVFEIGEDDKIIWRGELLAEFPRWTKLDADDLEAWNAWVNTPEIDEFLDEAMEKCQQLAKMSRKASGYMTLRSTPPAQQGRA